MGRRRQKSDYQYPEYPDDNQNQDKGKYCLQDYDCPSSKCCVDQKCTHPIICYAGSKKANQQCHYNYECGTQCCRDEQCKVPQECVQTCERNSDCDNLALHIDENNYGCCAHKRCTEYSFFCQGNKENGDFCDIDSECQSGNCRNFKCYVMTQKDLLNSSIDFLIKIIAILMTFIAFCFWLRFRKQQYTIQAPHNSHLKSDVASIINSNKNSPQSDKKAINSSKSTSDNPIQRKLNSQFKRGFKFNAKKVSTKVSTQLDQKFPSPRTKSNLDPLLDNTEQNLFPIKQQSFQISKKDLLEMKLDPKQKSSDDQQQQTIIKFQQKKILQLNRGNALYIVDEASLEGSHSLQYGDNSSSSKSQVFSTVSMKYNFFEQEDLTQI